MLTRFHTLADDAIRAIAAQPTPTTSATPAAQTSISDSQTLCSYTITPGQCVPVTYPPGTQEALEVAWEIVKYIFPFFFVATGETGASAPLGTLSEYLSRRVCLSVAESASNRRYDRWADSGVRERLCSGTDAHRFRVVMRCGCRQGYAPRGRRLCFLYPVSKDNV